VRWAREPGHDAYWHYRDAFLDGVVPAPRRSALDVGCGEGRVSRDLRARGHDVIGVDSSAALVRHAAAADPAGAYLVADAAALPFPDASFDLVVAYNALMDVDDLDASVAEAARVLAADGRLCVCVTHPINDSGRFAGPEPGDPFVIAGTYYGRRPFRVSVESGGLEMSFDGWSIQLELYSRALEAAGLAIEALREPLPAGGIQAPRRRWRRVPQFLLLRCRRPPRAIG
jgi:SAM-dependent methyltransferase